VRKYVARHERDSQIADNSSQCHQPVNDDQTSDGSSETPAATSSIDNHFSAPSATSTSCAALNALRPLGMPE
jgi:hypothetical protein